MNWEETVMDLDEYNEFTKSWYIKQGIPELWCKADVLGKEYKDTLEHQAKITWPIAFEEGRKSRDKEIDEAEQRGVKKVVDWMKLHKAYLCFDESDPAEIKNLNKAWQAFLKKCGK